MTYVGSNVLMLLQIWEKKTFPCHRRASGLITSGRFQFTSSSPDSMNTDRNDKSGLSSALYKLIVPLLRCEVVDIRDAAVSALGLINHDALKWVSAMRSKSNSSRNSNLFRDLMEELVAYIREAVDRKQENMRRRRRRDALRLQLVKVLKLIAENGTFGVSPCVLERDTMSLHPTFVDYMDGARLYLEAEIDKDNTSMREVKLHFCDFIRIMIKNFSREFHFVTSCKKFFFTHKNSSRISPRQSTLATRFCRATWSGICLICSRHGRDNMPNRWASRHPISPTRTRSCSSAPFR